jgi:hypothetical protein
VRSAIRNAVTDEPRRVVSAGIRLGPERREGERPGSLACPEWPGVELLDRTLDDDLALPLAVRVDLALGLGAPSGCANAEVVASLQQKVPTSASEAHTCRLSDQREALRCRVERRKLIFGEIE